MIGRLAREAWGHAWKHAPCAPPGATRNSRPAASSASPITLNSAPTPGDSSFDSSTRSASSASCSNRSDRIRSGPASAGELSQAPAQLGRGARLHEACRHPLERVTHCRRGRPGPRCQGRDHRCRGGRVARRDRHGEGQLRCRRGGRLRAGDRGPRRRSRHPPIGVPGRSRGHRRAHDVQRHRVGLPPRVVQPQEQPRPPSIGVSHITL